MNLKNEASEKYCNTGLNVGAMSVRYVNREFEQNKNNDETDAELYDYPEQDHQDSTICDEEVYANVEV